MAEKRTKRLFLTRAEAGHLSIATMSARAFLGLAVDGSACRNSLWLCAALGCALTVPLALLLNIRKAREGVLFRCALGIAALAAVWDASYLGGLILSSVRYCALDALPEWLTLLLTMAFCLYAAGKSGSGLGNAARLWGMLFAGVFAIVLLAEARHFEPKWLFPVFGAGGKAILRGGMSAAGMYAPGLMLFLLSDEPGTEKGRKTPLKALLSAGAVTTGLCLYTNLMAPSALTPVTRLFRLDELIANGRASLSLQLPVVFLWFMGLLAALCGYALLGAGCAERAAGKGAYRLWEALTLGAVFLLTLLDAPIVISPILWIALGSILLLRTLFGRDAV